jgi:hypothetical protein
VLDEILHENICWTSIAMVHTSKSNVRCHHDFRS